MSVKEFVHAMPKVELRLRLEGIFRKETLLLIAEQNDIPTTTKKFDQQAALLNNPTKEHFDDLIQTTTSWLRHPDDLTRLVYDMGVMLAKQNVRYAEVYLNPALHMLADMTFDDFMQAVNDGRDRVERGWGVRIQWLINIPRNEPRRADEALRWAGSVGGKRNGIVGIVLTGREDIQPAGQFERAFVNAQKKEVGTAVFAGDINRAEGVQIAVDVLKPSRILDGWGAWDSPELVDKLVNDMIPVDLALTRALKFGWVNSYEGIPLRRIYDENIKLTLSSDMPSIYQSSLLDEYLIALEQGGLSVDELEEIALNAITFSFMPESQKAQMREEFQQEYQRLRGEHLTQETAEG